MNILFDPVWSERASPVQIAGPRRGERWSDGLGEEVGPDGRVYQGPVDMNLYWDTVIEVIDPDAGRVVGRARIDRPVRTVEAGLYSFAEITDDLDVRIRIMQVGGGG